MYEIPTEFYVNTDRCMTEKVCDKPVNAIALACMYSRGRGIVVSASKIHRERGTWCTEPFGDGLHARLLVNEMPRGNAKIFQRYAKALQTTAQEVADAFIDGDTDKMFNLIRCAL